ncbi:hypothetical protein SeMB42_g05532 [Synchytrium endobioticum]|uniref:Flavoprotein domain-containing protein n=1 Tax=Synchytrium endobioticum TaxID=286115 RepID=A0A507CQX9_9FUNG|nr:hypothetical protein SeLEV6574_g06607 [Synchytrium endobioticum]TPX41544.1 hypothetical protein SeMB42_g05532 [Synchytrium endobioticum]
MSASTLATGAPISRGSHVSGSIQQLYPSESTQSIRPKHILIGATGSVASIKIPLLVRTLLDLIKHDEIGVDIRIVATERALHFFKIDECRPAEVLTDADEWKAWQRISDPVLHIDLRNWADLMVIAPLDANTLAKLANGLSDNFLTCILRAWEPSRPVIVCPAMNTFMWNHHFTAKHLRILTDELGYRVIPPTSKTLACGDTGIGAMASVEDIARIVMETLDFAV